MATILLQAAGAALGGMFGLAGKAIGMAAGSLAGYLIDRALIDSTRTIEGTRLSSAGAITAEEGAPIARLYGTMRLGGVVIWATRFEERRQVSRQGFKGGPRVIEYDYFGNLAIGLCEGEIAGVRRVWADGRELDLTTVEMRVHRGGEDQLPDPLIEAKQGAGAAPAYRGLAYVVFEGLPLEPYGNRIPQLHFEVMRPVSPLNLQVRAVTLIPGATEYGLSPEPIVAEPSEGETVALNRHVLTAPSDFAASLDELQALCPNLEHVALVVAWFGDDLRAGHCAIRPAVTDRAEAGFSSPWSVCGVDRAAARLTSRIDGRAAFGGTPSDSTVIAAIADLKARGLKVTLYPFVMMDIPPGNALPDPSGAVEQPAYPWRGRITGAVAPGRPGTTDGTALATAEIAAFAGQAEPGHFAIAATRVTYAGPANDFGYRRMALHCAALAAAAGGVDAILIGSELRGLTTLRNDADAYPFVGELARLAADMRAMLGPATRITYGADWTEYGGHRPEDGSGDLRFPLDELWAHPAIDAVGIDNYMPLSDWRDEDWSGGNPDGASGPADRATMTAAIGGGEGYDWFYASNADRDARARTPIEDGACAKPWVFRPKDLVAWWSHAHVERFGGVESAQPTAWTPRSKPVWFTELGCPAVDKGANQPNVFPDPKSADSGRPHFSNGGRDDNQQFRFLAAHMARWDHEDPAHDVDWNPVSPLYGGRMLPRERVYLWTWDARPYPAFPAMGAVWGDAGNHGAGHWLNGRLGGAPLDALIGSILGDHGLPPADAAAADGYLAGYVVERPGSAREALEPLIDLFGLVATEAGGALSFAAERGLAAATLDKADLVDGEDAPLVWFERTPDSDLPAETLIAFHDPLRDHQAATARVVEPEGRGRQGETIGLPAALDPGQAEALAADRMRRLWTGRNRTRVAVPFAERAPAAGAAARFADAAPPGDWLTLEAEEGLERRLTLRAIDRLPPHAAARRDDGDAATIPAIAGAPLAEFLDLPLADADAPAETRLLVAAWARPWRPQAVLASPAGDGFGLRARLDAPARMGALTTPLQPAPESLAGRVVAGGFDVRLSDGALSSASRAALLNGANLAAVRAANGVWEILQFESAEEVAAGVFRLSGLLRGQGGTEDAAAAGAPSGARFVSIDDAVKAAGLRAAERGLALNWRVGPLGLDAFRASQATGGDRARLLLAPVHLRARRTADGAMLFAWVRRGRFAADAWDGEEIPLDASAERYRLKITADGATLAEAECATPQWSWPANAVAAAAGANLLRVEVRQTSPELGPGLPATLEFHI